MRKVVLTHLKKTNGGGRAVVFLSGLCSGRAGEGSELGAHTERH